MYGRLWCHMQICWRHMQIFWPFYGLNIVPKVSRPLDLPSTVAPPHWPSRRHIHLSWWHICSCRGYRFIRLETQQLHRLIRIGAGQCLCTVVCSDISISSVCCSGFSIVPEVSSVSPQSLTSFSDYFIRPWGCLLENFNFDRFFVFSRWCYSHHSSFSKHWKIFSPFVIVVFPSVLVHLDLGCCIFYILGSEQAATGWQ